MLINDCFKVRGLILAAAFFAGLGLGTNASAITRSDLFFLVDLNSRTATPIGNLGGNFSEAHDINDAGQVVGLSRTAEGTRRAFITGPNGVGIRDLGTLGGNSSHAYGINNAGQVVGWSDTAGGEVHAFITGSGGVGMRDLGVLDGTDNSSGRVVNDAGQVAGVSHTDRGIPRVFITGPDGVGRRELGTLGGSYIEVHGINNAGQVVGYSDTGDSVPGHTSYPTHAFITGPDGIGMRDLGTLGGTDRQSIASGINDAGQVVGGSMTGGPGGTFYAFITGPDGVGMRNLGTLGSDSYYSSSFAAGINNAEQVVGSSEISEFGDSRAFITGPNGVGMMDLNSLFDPPPGVILTGARAINNAGQVLAVGYIPEPEIYALLLAGLALVGFVARRKKSEIRI